ncbi:long-chain-fatty-acid--CoA ligase 5 isoform X1 [Patella vulgata]|uniref:long-chain-fatty-acid--CoA ligase 5 isoform X1 n=2 Tax=Patella vulgata TaxID=6465 RepID=UPI00217F7B43|nr:long-chain-fatty-acid--CoA ligase 5 isoform X1 [Patella vulgata]
MQYSTGIYPKMEYLKLAGASVVTVGAVGTAAALYLSQGPEPIPLITDMNNQTQPWKHDGMARISRMCKNGDLLEYQYDDAKTLLESFKRGARISNNGPCLGRKPSSSEPFEWITYNEVLERAKNVGAGLVKLGHRPVNSTHLGIYSQNRPEYVIFDQGLYMYSMVGVPLYDTLGTEACNFIINQAKLETVVCDTNAKVKNLLDRWKETKDTLKCIVCMETMSDENQTKANANGIKTMLFSELEKLGKDNPVKENPATPDDLCLICYTSGTTGLPKGAMLSHKGLVAVVSAIAVQLQPAGVDIGPGETMISYLPLAHSYERMLECYIFTHGAKLGFFQGDVRKLMDDIKELQPTLFPTVPRLLNRFYDKVMAGVNASTFKKFLFNIALGEKEKEIKRGVIRDNSIWDQLVFKKIQAALGGKVKLITTGSAPLSPKVLSFLRCIVGCPVIEGYGQTESHAISTLQLPGDAQSGTVGPPLACNAIKLCDVTEMEYYAKNNKGEICVKGPNVFTGYLNDRVKTKEALDDDGWLHTGDIGEWLPSGTLKIIDRKKHIFKLAQGEYIAPEKIENVYVRSSLISQVFVHGDSLQACLIGIVVPDPDLLPKFCKQKLNLTGNISDLARNPEVKKAIMADLVEVGKKSGLQSFEQIKDVYVYPEMFSVENGLLTPTFKAKRQELLKYFKKQLQEMYDKMA